MSLKGPREGGGRERRDGLMISCVTVKLTMFEALSFLTVLLAGREQEETIQRSWMNTTQLFGK